MLLSAPTEVTEMILSLLDLPSLAKTSQTCHRLRHLSIPPLYRTVTITTYAQLNHFFIPTPIPGLSSSLALERALARRADLDSIRHLVLDLYAENWGSSIGSLPKILSLRSQPLQLDSLRISYSGSLVSLLSLIRYLDPRKLEMHWTFANGGDAEWGVLLSLGTKAFRRVETLTLSPTLPDPYWGLIALGGRTVKSTPFKNVTRGTLLVRDQPDLGIGHRDEFVFAIVERFLAFNPALKSLRVVVCDVELQAKVEAFLEEVYGGSGKFDSLVVEVGERVRLETDDCRVVWPGDVVSDDKGLVSIV